MQTEKSRVRQLILSLLKSDEFKQKLIEKGGEAAAISYGSLSDADKLELAFDDFNRYGCLDEHGLKMKTDENLRWAFKSVAETTCVQWLVLSCTEPYVGENKERRKGQELAYLKSQYDIRRMHLESEKKALREEKVRIKLIKEAMKLCKKALAAK